MAACFVLIVGQIAAFGATLTGFWDWWKGLERDPGGPIGKAKHTQVWRTVNWHAVLMLSGAFVTAANILTRSGTTTSARRRRSTWCCRSSAPA